jgi:NAD+ synthase
MDLCLWAKDHEVSAVDAAPVLGLSRDQVDRAYAMIDSKRAVAKYLHAGPLLVAELSSELNCLSAAAAL